MFVARKSVMLTKFSRLSRDSNVAHYEKSNSKLLSLNSEALVSLIMWTFFELSIYITIMYY
jgi:hypothetical protein